MGIVTDSTPVDQPKNPDTCNVFQLYRLLATPAEIADLKEKYQKGGYGYGDAKKLLLEKIMETFEPYRKKRIELEADLGYVDRVLREGADRARIEAKKTLDEVRKKIGTRP